MTFRALLVMLAASALLSAQNNASAISGTVEDQTGSRVAGAVVAVRSIQTGLRTEMATGPDGAFRFPSLPFASYEIQATHPGFSVFKKLLDLQTEPVSLTIPLSTATLSEAVLVSASTDLLQPNRATNTATLNAAQITSLPTASRNYTHLIVTEAGVSAPLPDRTGKGMNLATSPGAQADDGAQSLNPSVNGARPTNNSVSLNGVDTTNMMNANGSLGNNISMPAEGLTRWSRLTPPTAASKA